MTNKNENINQDLLNNEKEDNISKLEEESSEQSETIDTETNSATETETVENEDCGNLPQNQKDDKKNKWLLLAISIVTVIFAGLLTTQFLSKDNKPEKPIDYMQYVQGIEDLELTVTKNDYDYLSGVTFDKEQINSVTVDDSQVDLTKAGNYPLTYLIDVKDEKAEDLKQVVTVKVVSDSKKEEPKKDDGKKDNTSTSSKPSDESSTNDSNNTTSKPNNNGSSSSNSNTSKPSNSGGSNKKPASPTHTHRFVAEYRDIQHEEKGHYETVTISEAWDEPVYENIAYMVCNECYLEMYSSDEYHSHCDATLHGGFRDMYKSVLIDTIHHPAKTEKQWVVDENGWTETVTTGFHCSCGATK